MSTVAGTAGISRANRYHKHVGNTSPDPGLVAAPCFLDGRQVQHTHALQAARAYGGWGLRPRHLHPIALLSLHFLDPLTTPPPVKEAEELVLLRNYDMAGSRALTQPLHETDLFPWR